MFLVTEHDDRYSSSSGSDYVPNKRGGRGRNFRGKRGGYRGHGRGGGGVNPRSRFDDDGDISMEGEDGPSSSASRYNPYGSRPPSRRGQRGGSYRDRLAMDKTSSSALSRLGLPVNSGGRGRQDRGRGGRGYNSRSGGDNSWFKVTIPYGKKYEKDFILKSINNVCEVPFIPVKYHYENNAGVFYLEDSRAADALRDVSRRISLPNGFKMIVLVRSCPAPGNIRVNLPLDQDGIDKLKIAMSKKYTVDLKYLDLSDWFNDETLKEHNLRLPLSQTANMEYVVNIIAEEIPEICVINLSDNRISSLESLSALVEKAPTVTKLDLSGNQIRSDHELDKILGWKITDLNLKGNNMCNRIGDQATYVSTIRKKFPKLVRLDGQDLPPLITFDVDKPTDLPPVKGSYFGNSEVQGIIVRFIEQYCSIYDSENRQQLIDAYHDEAVFSMNCCYNKAVPTKQHNFNDYIQDSRNLLKVKDSNKRFKLLKTGKINVISHLSQLPQTKHDMASFTVDVTCQLPILLSFTLNGVFKEPNNPSNRGTDFVIRTFSRTFVTVPQGTGIAITNDQLHISNASSEQSKNAFKSPAPTPSPSPVPPSVASTSGASSTAPSDAQKQEMVQRFAEQSGMNHKWSINCLNQNNWDYQQSAKVFTDFHSKGSIPPEAFVK